MTRLAAPCLLLVLGVFGRAVAGETPSYGPVPESLAAVRGTDTDEALATKAVLVLEAGVMGDALLDARALLVLIEDVGLRHAAERLARGDVPPALLPHLLHVVSSAAHPAADVFLVQAAKARRAEIRMTAATGLGRGRSEAAVDALDALCRDPVPGVRAAALRSLFALDTDAAVAARHALPVDGRPDLHARRLRWHRVRGRAGPDLVPMARDAWTRGRTPQERTEAARLLALPSVDAPLGHLEEVVAEMGTDALGATAARLARGVPRPGYDRKETRLAAIMAAFVSAARGDETLRAHMVDRMVGWLAQPVRLDRFATGPPEDVLRMVLPDWGAVVTEPTLRRLRANRFREPNDGVDLLLEALDEEQAAAALRSLLAPSIETPVRVAAAGGLRSLGRIGDAELARYLLRPEEEAIIRRDAVRAIVGDDADWAIPLLDGFIANEDPLLAGDAISVLELRPEEAARSLLIEHLFERATHPEIRMEHLVRPADDAAFEILERALADNRVSLRKAALRQFHQVPSLREDERSLSMVRAYVPRAKDRAPRTNELQQLLYAWFALAPREGVRWMREHWAVFHELDWEDIPIRSLQNVPSGRAAEDAVDLVLEKATEGAAPEILQEATTALRDRRGHRDEEIDAFWRRALSHADEGVALHAIYSLDRPGHADLTDLLVPLFEAIDPSDTAELPKAEALLDIMRHQPLEKVEPLLLRLLVDANTDPTLRQKAAVALLDRLSAEGRASLLAWLTSEKAGQDDAAVTRLVARVVGSGGGPDVAHACYVELARLLLETYDSERSLDPDVPPEGEYGWHIGALARAIAFTKDEPAVRKVLALVLDERFARFARHAVSRQGRRLSPDDATSVARQGPRLFDVWHRNDARYAPLPAELSQILANVKAVDDAVLARGLEDLLAEARHTGRLATFPDLFFDRVIAHLRERSTGDRVRAAAAVEQWVLPTEPVGGATDFDVERQRVTRFAREARYEDAAWAQERALAILAQRAYDDELGWDWRRERSVLDAWRGAAAAAKGNAADAEVWFVNAFRRFSYDSPTLSTTARARALNDVGLETALQLAERAAQLERRVRDQVSRDNADTLALVLLKLGRFDEAAAVIEPVLRRVERFSDPGGRYHLRAAQARLGMGDRRGARDAILKALRFEPSLDGEMRRDPWLESLAGDGTLDALIRRAEDEALTPTIE